MIVWDDVGYGALQPFGGPIETPAMQRIAEHGVRYSNFHTTRVAGDTALCSPTRSSMLNGRNATSNNMACITEAAAGFSGPPLRNLADEKPSVLEELVIRPRPPTAGGCGQTGDSER